MTSNNGDIEMPDDEPASAHEALEAALERERVLEADLRNARQEAIAQTESHQAEITALRQELAQSTATTESLQTQITGLGGQVTAAITGAESANASAFAALQQTIDDLRRENAAYAANRVTMEAEIDWLNRAGLNEGGNDLQDMTMQRDEIEAQRDNFHYQINSDDGYLNTITRLEEQLAQVDAQAAAANASENEELKEQLKNLPTPDQWAEVQAQLRAYQELQTEHEDLQLLNQSQERQLKDARLDLARAQLELAQSSAGQNGAEIGQQSGQTPQDPEARNAELLLQVRTYEVQIAEHDAQITNLRQRNEQEIARLREEHRQEITRNQTNAQEELTRARDEYTRLEARFENVRGELRASDRELQTARTALNEAEERHDNALIENLREVREEYAERFAATLRRIEDFERQVRELEAERDQIAENDNLLLQANQRIEELENDTTVEDELYDQINEEQKETARVRDELEEALARIAKLQADLDACRANHQGPSGTGEPQRSSEDIATIDTHQTQLTHLNAIVAGLQAENDYLQTQIDSANQGHDHQEVEAARTEKEKELQKLKDDCVREKAALTRDLGAARAENELLEANLEQAVDDIATAKANCAKEKDALRKEIETAQARIQQQVENELNQIETNTNNEAHIQNLTTDNHALTTGLSAARALAVIVETKIAEHEQAIKTLSQHAIDDQHLIRLLHERIEGLDRDRQEHQDESARLAIEVQGLRTTIAQQNVKLAELRQRLNTCEQKRAAAVQSALEAAATAQAGMESQQSNTVEQLNDQVDTLQLCLEVTEHERDIALEEVQQLQAAAGATGTETDTDAVRELNNQLANLQLHLEALEQERREAVEEVRRLQAATTAAGATGTESNTVANLNDQLASQQVHLEPIEQARREAVEEVQRLRAVTSNARETGAGDANKFTQLNLQLTKARQLLKDCISLRTEREATIALLNIHMAEQRAQLEAAEHAAQETEEELERLRADHVTFEETEAERTEILTQLNAQLALNNDQRQRLVACLSARNNQADMIAKLRDEVNNEKQLLKEAQQAGLEMVQESIRLADAAPPTEGSGIQARTYTPAQLAYLLTEQRQRLLVADNARTEALAEVQRLSVIVNEAGDMYRIVQTNIELARQQRRLEAIVTATNDAAWLIQRLELAAAPSSGIRTELRQRLEEAGRMRRLTLQQIQRNEGLLSSTNPEAADTIVELNGALDNGRTLLGSYESAIRQNAEETRVLGESTITFGPEPDPATETEQSGDQARPRGPLMHLRNGRSYTRVTQNQRNTTMTRNQVPLYTGPPSSSKRVTKRPTPKKAKKAKK